MTPYGIKWQVKGLLAGIIGVKNRHLTSIPTQVEFLYPKINSPSVRHVVCVRYVTTCRSTMDWFWGSFRYGESEKNYSRALESAGTSRKSDQKLASKTLITFFYWFHHVSPLVDSFFLILHIKNHPQNHFIVLRHELTYGFLIFTCHTLNSP